MEDMSIENITFNYFVNTTSYVKTILDSLPNDLVSNTKKMLIVELFNGMLKQLSKDKLAEIIEVSNDFKEKFDVTPVVEKQLHAKYLYKNFLEKMLFDSFNRVVYLNIMHECIKVYTDYYQEYNDTAFYQLNDNAVGNIRIK